MAEWKDEPAIVFRGVVSSYAQLLERTSFWQDELSRLGVGAGSVVVVEAGFSPGAVGLVLALIRCGAVVVPLTPLSHVHLAQFEQISEANWTFLFDERDGYTLAVHDRKVTNELTRKLIAMGHPGLVIFSSGSTGAPKAVLHDFAALLEKFRRPGVRKSTLTFLLFDHIGGMDTLFNTLANGGTLVTTVSRDPDVVCRAIAEHHVHTLPTSPTFLNLLLISGAHREHDLSSLQVIAYGTEPMSQAVLV